MADQTRQQLDSQDFLLSRSTEDDRYGLWRFDVASDALLQRVPLDPDAKFDRTHQVVSIGGYLLEWGPVTLQAYDPCFPYRLFELDPSSPDPLGVDAVQKGLWTKKKFWSYRADFGNPNGANEGYDKGDELMLVPLGNFLLNVIPTTGRGTFQLWNFDPNPVAPGTSDPLPVPYTPQGSFDTIEFGHELIPLGNYVLDRIPATGEYWLWSFDPQNEIPLALPAVQAGRWASIDAGHSLVAIGDLILDWVPADRSYRLWGFDPRRADPLVGPIRSGVLPAELDVHTKLTGIQQRRAIDPARAAVPGTIDFMRSKIKHVVYLMIENRSFDHVCGWLYEKGEKGIHFIGGDQPYDGASLDMYNVDPDAKGGPQKVYLNVYEGGKLSVDWLLDFLPQDPYHDHSDVMRQFFYENRSGYADRATPTMSGFVWNNGTDAVMSTYGPEQLPVLNGLAKGFAISDAWFSSMPGPTDTNRAFAFTGSALCKLNNFQNGNEYIYWPYTPHRPSIWKVLWSNGVSDWKIYNSVEWMNFVHTYHLFLAGQIPSVDANTSSYIAGIDQFKKDALAGKLPTFSFLEPAWIATTGTTSYHPGADLVPGERALNEIYEALKNGPAWNETLFIVTFDEHGGIFDHVAPPYAVNPWPNDDVDGFRYDMMGVRVPTILISPWIEQQTVFRSTTGVPYDSTSILATLLEWLGIPRARWFMGDRTAQAPTFEGVLTRNTPRTDAPTLTPPYDKDFPPEGDARSSTRVTDLHRLMVPRLVWAMADGRLTAVEATRASDEILSGARDQQTLGTMLAALQRRLG